MTTSVFCFSVNAIALADTAKSAVLINADTKEVIFEKNAYETLPMASTTKIMTSLILAEQQDLEKRIVCTNEMVTVEGSSMGLLPGDIVTYNDLLYGMLLASGNDAANTTAISIAGSIENFVKIMNLRARLMGLHSTNFATPSGLDNENHYSTAYDMAVLTSYALKNAKFRTAASSYTKRLCYGNPPYNRTLTNHNKLLKSYDGLIGVKTGFTKKSGRCLVTAAERDGATVIAVTLNDPNDWQSHKNLLNFGFSALQTTELCVNLEDVRLDVSKGTLNSLAVKSNTVVVNLLPENYKRVKEEVILPQSVSAPIDVGDVVGKVKYYLDDNLIETADIYSITNVERLSETTFCKKFFSNFKRIFLKI